MMVVPVMLAVLVIPVNHGFVSVVNRCRRLRLMVNSERL